MPATITIRQRALSGWSLRSWLCCSLVLFATCLQAQTVCGPVLIEADELLHKGFFSDLENLLAPCLAVEATHPTTKGPEPQSPLSVLADGRDCAGRQPIRQIQGIPDA